MENLKSNKIVLAQLNPISGDVEYNKLKAIEAIKKANDLNADLVVFPELFLSGYPIWDILGRFPQVAEQVESALDEIKEYAVKISVLIGFPEINNEKHLKPFYNSVAFIRDKKIEKIIRKSFYSDFMKCNDYKYFEPYKFEENDRVIKLNKNNFLITIGDNCLSDVDLAFGNVDCLICCSSSCSKFKKEQLKHKVMSDFAKKYGIKYIYVNQTGANDELV